MRALRAGGETPEGELITGANWARASARTAFDDQLGAPLVRLLRGEHLGHEHLELAYTRQVAGSGGGVGELLFELFGHLLDDQPVLGFVILNAGTQQV